MAAALGTALLCLPVSLAPGSGAAKAGQLQHRPNIVVVMTDDQHADSTRFMPQLQRLVADQGVTFENSFASYSFCCPSRATFFTGQYAKNHGVLSNEPPLGGYEKLAPSLGNALPVWLQRSGYRTGHFGHFLNGYATHDVPPGWNEWNGTVGGGGAYGYTLNENGTWVGYGNYLVADPPKYQTDVLTNKAVNFIRRRAPSDSPFFLSVAPFAPHTECGCDNDPRAAPRHEGAFAEEPLPKPPSYDEEDVSDKPELTRGLTPIPPFAEAQVTKLYRNRLESLLAVDDMVARIVGNLSSRGELKNTVIIFTSDNGFLHGEHRWRTGKVLPYEPSIRVPLLIRGPGVPEGKRRGQPVMNVDLAPTILDLANARPGRPQDGRSLMPLLKRKLLRWGRGILLEAYYNAGGEYGPTTRIVYKGVRTDRYMYARYESGEEELYDLENDPFELESRHGDPAYDSVQASLRRLSTELQQCRGPSCASRPALKLRLRFRRQDGCTDSGILARLRGADAGEVRLVRFYKQGRKLGSDAVAPFIRGIGARALSARRRNRIMVSASMLDGREVTVKRTAPPAC